MGIHRTMQIKTGFILSALALGVLSGCDTNNTTNSSPNPETLMPKGTIQGDLTDSQTGQPVVGAVISIGVARATTDANGHYIMNDVPANTRINNTALTAAYTAVIDTSAVSSPISMTDTTYTGPKYAVKDTTCNTMNAVFSTLGEVSAAGSGETSSTNHDTPVTNLVAVANFTIGKLSGAISGMVYDIDGSTPLADVNIDVTAADCPGTLIVDKSITTDSTGAYKVAGIEAGFTPTVRAYTSDNAKTAANTLPVMVEGRTYDGDNGANLILGLNDTVGPVLIKTSYENNQDLAPGSDIAVVFTWNEPIISNEYSTNTTADSTPTATNRIYNDVTVNYTGAKTGNVAHTIAWNATNTALTVTIPAAAVSPTSAYTISTATGRTSGRMTDAAGNVYTLGTNILDTINLTTNGGTDLSATSPSVAVFNATVDYNTFPVTIDWLPVSGAAGYNVYRSATIGATTVPLELIGTVTSSSFADADQHTSNKNGDTGADCSYPSYTTCNNNGTTGNANNNTGAENRGGRGFVSGENVVRYTYQVAAVNANHVEGALSTAVTAADTTTLKLASITGNAVTDVDGDGNCETVTAVFSEPVNESLAETGSNYTYTLGTTQNATLTAESAKVTSAAGAVATVVVTFPDATACASFTDDADNTEIFSVKLVTDAAGNVIDVAKDSWHQDSTAID